MFRATIEVTFLRFIKRTHSTVGRGPTTHKNILIRERLLEEMFNTA